MMKKQTSPRYTVVYKAGDRIVDNVTGKFVGSVYCWFREAIEDARMMNMQVERSKGDRLSSGQ